jgi:hypothetical protein
MTESVHPILRDGVVSTSRAFGQETLAAPSTAIDDPYDVLDSIALGKEEKRAILASWASDACAVEGMPAWRRLPRTGTLVPVDDILDALRALDRRTLN